MVSDIQGTTVDDDPILGDDYSAYPWSSSLNYYDSDIETLSSIHGTGRTTSQIKDVCYFTLRGGLIIRIRLILLVVKMEVILFPSHLIMI